MSTRKVDGIVRRCAPEGISIAITIGGYEGIVELLLDRGADFDAQGGYCSTAL